MAFLLLMIVELSSKSEPLMLAIMKKKGAISIKIFLTRLFTPTYFAVAVSHSELKLTQTFTVTHEMFSP